MRIAVTSQNRREITAHAGKCRFFWIYDCQENIVTAKQSLEIGRELTLSHDAHMSALENIHVLICANMGTGLYQRLARQGITPLLTAERTPDEAIKALLAGKLDTFSPHHVSHCHDTD